MVVGMTQLYESIRNTKWEGPSLLLEHHGYRSCMFESQSVFSTISLGLLKGITAPQQFYLSHP